MLLAWAIATASLAWAALLVWTASSHGAPLALALIHQFASFICHQELDRTFHWGATPWAVCARCLGLYVAAPAGALAAFAPAFRRAPSPGVNVRVLLVAGTPTAATWLAEHLAGIAVGNTARFAAAIPLGAALAWVLVTTAIAARPSGVSQYTLKDARRGPSR